MANFDAQIARMQALYNYGRVDENKNTVSKHLEHQKVGADGNSYAIIKENAKYFIKTAPKEKANLSEAYNYIGGWMNHKANEFNSYNQAIEHFNILMKSLNEAYNVKVISEDSNRFMKNDLLTECTEEMRNEIARQRQIMYNAAAIMNEANTIAYTMADPEGKAKATDPKKQGGPYEENAKAELDGDFKKTTESPEKVGSPYGDKGESIKGEDANVKDSVASAHPSGGKAVKMNEEAENTMTGSAPKADLEGDKPFAQGLPADGGTSEIGDGTPYVETVKEEAEIDPEAEADEEGSDEPAGLPVNEEALPEVPAEEPNAGILEGEDELDSVEDEDDYDFSDDDIDLGDEEGDIEDIELDDEPVDAEADVELGDEEPAEDSDQISALLARVAELEAKVAELEGGEEEFDAEDELGAEEEPVDAEADVELGDEEPAEDDFDFSDEDEAPVEDVDECGFMNESRIMSIVESVFEDFKAGKLNEDNLNVWGKHPGYRKKPFTLPETGKDKTEHGEDWNDESVYSEEPFGSKIGSGMPYDQVVKKITDSILESLKKKD